jgi:hypothetical protein
MRSLHVGLGVFSLVAALASTLQAAPVYTQLGNSGTLQVTTYSPSLVITSGTVPSPYGNVAPTISAVPGGYKLTFTLSPGFLVNASNVAGGRQEAFLAKLDFQIAFDGPIKLTARMEESGMFGETGQGDASVFGGLVVRSVDGPVEQLANGLLGSNATFANGTWSSFAQVSGFQNAHQTYRLTIDNDLIAFAPPVATPSTAFIRKDTFSIIVTGDGPVIPEPGCLSLFAVGATSLLIRRRR